MALIAAFAAGILVFALVARFFGRSNGPAARFFRMRSSDWHDNPNVIRIDEHAPPGFEICLAWECPVAGISRREPDAEDFVAGRNRRLELLREPDNPVSPFAVKVIGEWTDGADNIRRAHLGYIPDEFAKSIATRAPDAKLAAALRDLFIPMDGKGAGIRLNIWADSQLERKERHKRYAQRRRAETKAKPS
jgi:hypothetical protein